MKNLVVYLVMAFLLLSQIGCSSDNTHKISTITLEKVGFEGDASSGYNISWRLVADPAPDKDLVVVIGGYRKSDDWFDYNRREWKMRIKSDNVPPFYAVIEKSNRHSSTYQKFVPASSLYINTLPSVKIVGQDISIDTDTLAETLPAKTLGGQVIPEGHEFLPYWVGKEYGLNKNGGIIIK